MAPKESFTLHVLSYDGSTGIVDMRAQGPQEAECDGAELLVQSAAIAEEQLDDPHPD